MSTRTSASARPKAVMPPTASIDETVATPPPTIDPICSEAPNTVINNTQDIVALGKQNLEAVSASSQIWVAGIKELSEQAAASAKASYEDSLAAFKALTAVKTANEAIEFQNGFAKAVIANAIAGSQKLAEASRKLTEQALAPLTARFAATVESFGKTV